VLLHPQRSAFLFFLIVSMVLVRAQSPPEFIELTGTNQSDDQGNRPVVAQSHGLEKAL
jgi:hypothetical protein